MFEFIQQLIEASEKKEKTEEKKTKKKSVSDTDAAAVYHRDYVKTKNKSYRTEQ